MVQGQWTVLFTWYPSYIFSSKFVLLTVGFHTSLIFLSLSEFHSGVVQSHRLKFQRLIGWFRHVVDSFVSFDTSLCWLCALWLHCSIASTRLWLHLYKTCIHVHTAFCPHNQWIRRSKAKSRLPSNIILVLEMFLLLQLVQDVCGSCNCNHSLSDLTQLGASCT